VVADPAHVAGRIVVQKPASALMLFLFGLAVRTMLRMT
jgi:hypothetical protein